MEWLIFKTDIKTTEKVAILKSIFSDHPVITEWSIDTSDIDNVLRIKSSANVNEYDVIKLVKPYGFNCEPLPD